jgi:hypothetical protein
MSAQAASSLKKSPAPVAFGAELRAGAVGELPLFSKGSYAYDSSVIDGASYSTHLHGQFAQPRGAHAWGWRSCLLAVLPPGGSA